MKIAIAPITSPFINFFFSLARYLEAAGNQVVFLDPDKYIRSLLKKNGLDYVEYKRSPAVRYFNSNSNLIIYYRRLLNIKDEERLIRKRDIEYSDALNFFKQNTDIDKVLFWNGEGNVEDIICKEAGIDSMYFENGYFPDTLQLNYEGVNCNAGYSHCNLEEFTGYFFPEAELPKAYIDITEIRANTWLRYLKRLSDKKYSYLLPYIIKSNKARKDAASYFKKLTADSFEFSNDDRYIFIPLQVNSDTQIILNSPFRSMYEVLDSILPQLRGRGYKILIKEHPAEVENVDYSRFIDNKETFLLKKYPVEKLIDNSDFTVCVNSSVGLQAIERNKRVVILGESLYSAAPNAINWIPGTDIIDTISNHRFDPAVTKKYISHLKNNIFIQGNWRDPDIDLLHRITSRILGKASE